jgi:hypothetical protein
VSRLDDFGIQLMIAGPPVAIYVRGECIGTVAGGSQGSTGMLTPAGLAYLVWRDEQPFLVGKGVETPATPEQVETIRKFSEDLKTALST